MADGVDVKGVHSAVSWSDNGTTIDRWWEKQSLLPFKPCSSICISGTTGSGKTHWTYKLLRHAREMFVEEPPHRIVYCYGVWQPLFDEMEENIENFTLHPGLPTQVLLSEISSNGKHNLIVLDDMIDQVVKNPEMELLFTRGCHHSKFSVINITQNIFQQGKHARTIALNTWYMILFRNMRDVSQISILGKQLFPGNAQVLKEAYEDATKKPYGYLVIDSSPHVNVKYRLRTRIFPGEDPIVYVPNV